MTRLLRIALAAGATALATASPAAAALPDLVADRPERPRVVDDPDRQLLRFDGYIHNAGPGALVVRAADGVVTQRVEGEGGTFEELPLPRAQVQLEASREVRRPHCAMQGDNGGCSRLCGRGDLRGR